MDLRTAKDKTQKGHKQKTKHRRAKYAQSLLSPIVNINIAAQKTNEKIAEMGRRWKESYSKSSQ